MIDQIKSFIYSYFGVVIGAMFAGEYFQPSKVISNFLDQVRGR